MGHTHLNLEVELGYSHLLSNMEIASSTDANVCVRMGQRLFHNHFNTGPPSTVCQRIAFPTISL